MRRTWVQKSPFTSRTRPPIFSSRDAARHASNWSTYGYMHADVLPVPTAPRIMTPVCRPRRGMVSHVGRGDARRLRRVMLLAEDQKRLGTRRGLRVAGQRSVRRPFVAAHHRDIQQRA